MKMKTTEIVVLEGDVTPCETYCHSCKQLRLWAKPEKPEACGNCGSAQIEVDRVGSERLWLLTGRGVDRGV